MALEKAFKAAFVFVSNFFYMFVKFPCSCANQIFEVFAKET